MEGTADISYGLARMGLLKSVVVAWIRAGGTNNPPTPESVKIHRIFKHAEVQLLAFFGGHKEEALLRAPKGACIKRRPKPATWGVRL